MDIVYLTASEAVQGFASRSLSPVELTESVLARIESLNGTLNAFCFVDAEGALKEARESEARWKSGAPKGGLDGIPTSVKDLWAVAGMPTRRGSACTDQMPATEDAPAVARLREQGVVILGKTTMCEFGWKGVTDSPAFGVSRNPWDTSKTCGGSSGGAAIAAAAGLGILHLGSDGAGSIRIPAAFCGVFGFKSTWGRVAAFPLGPLPMLSHSGPIVRSVSDARLMLSAIAKPDVRDWLCLPEEDITRSSRYEGSLAGLRVAYSPDLGYVQNVDPDVAAGVEAAVAVLAGLGATVIAVEAPFPSPEAAFKLTFNTGFAAILSSFGEADRAKMDQNLVAMSLEGDLVRGVDVMNAWATRDELGRHMNAFHRAFDVLVTPQMPVPPLEAGRHVVEEFGSSWLDWSPFTYPFNFTGQPAASVPCGLTRKGLPIAFQVVGGRYADATVLRVCEAYESQRPFCMPISILRHYS